LDNDIRNIIKAVIENDRCVILLLLLRQSSMNEGIKNKGWVATITTTKTALQLFLYKNWFRFDDFFGIDQIIIIFDCY